MKLVITFILFLVPICITVAQKNVYLKNNETGHLKKLKKKTILTFKTSETTFVTGTIIAVTDSTFSVSTYEKHKKSDTINIQIKSVSQVINKLMNKKGLATTSYFFGTLGLIGLVTSPFLLITDTPEDALGLLEASAGLIGIGAVLYSPYWMNRKFNTNNKWTIITK